MSPSCCGVFIISMPLKRACLYLPASTTTHSSPSSFLELGATTYYVMTGPLHTREFIFTSDSSSTVSNPLTLPQSLLIKIHLTGESHYHCGFYSDTFCTICSFVRVSVQPTPQGATLNIYTIAPIPSLNDYP